MGRAFSDGIAHAEHAPGVSELHQAVSRELLRRDAANQYPLGFHTQKVNVDVDAVWDDFVRVNASGLQVTLPQIRSADDLGRRVVVGNLGDYTTTVAARSGQLIEQLPTAEHSGFGFRQYIVADAAQWIVSQMPAGSVTIGGAGEKWTYLPSSNPSTVGTAPSALWQFDGGASSLSNRMGGTGLTEFGGPAGYSVVSGLVGKRFKNPSGSNFLYGSYGDAAVIANGAMTVELMLSFQRETLVGTTQIGGVGEVGTVATQDLCWALEREGNEEFQYQHQSTGPVTRTWQPTVHLGQQMQLLTLTRDSAGTGVKLYVDGQPMGSNTMAAAPGSTGGGRLLLGVLDNGAGSYYGVITCMRFTKAEFTPAEVLVGYQQARGVA